MSRRGLGRSAQRAQTPMALEPCPLCGSTALEEAATAALEIRGGTYQSGWIERRAGGAEGPSIELADEAPGRNGYPRVRDAWNRRVLPAKRF